MMRSHCLQTIRAALAVLALSSLVCAGIGVETAKADSPANARALQLPEVLLLCEPLDNSNATGCNSGKSEMDRSETSISTEEPIGASCF